MNKAKSPTEDQLKAEIKCEGFLLFSKKER